ncbi:MAG: serine/threonine-protein kinase, partial [Candidatus Krumholzibacteriia bacterium]
MSSQELGAPNRTAGTVFGEGDGAAREARPAGGGPETATWDGSTPPPGAPRPELPPRWRPVRRLGGGGQAEVWLAHDLDLGEMVVVKLIGGVPSPEAVRRLQREVSVGREIRHPNIVRLYELIETASGPAITMAWCEGGTLAGRIPSGGLPIAEVLTLARQLLEGLSHLHRLGIVHRDVKPSNVLVDADGTWLLGDLGLAKAEGAERLTCTGLAAGTPAYMSPEQLRGWQPGFPSDLYALGMTLLEALNGSPPFGDTWTDTRGRDPFDPRPVNPRRARPDCPRWLARFILRLVERRPQDRFPHAGAALAAFSSRRWLGLRRGRRQAIGLGGASLLWYTPLPQARPGPLEGDPPFVCDADGTTRFLLAGREWGIDRWGNPLSGPNAGRDLGAHRLAFLRDLGTWHPSRVGTPELVQRRRQQVQSRYPELLAERPYREILDLHTARALAAAGAPLAGAALLRARWRDGGNDYVGLQVAQLEAIAGELEAALATL